MKLVVGETARAARGRGLRLAVSCDIENQASQAIARWLGLSPDEEYGVLCLTAGTAS